MRRTNPFSQSIMAAQAYAKRGWAPLPLKPKSKLPAHSDWPALRLKPEDVEHHFRSGDANVGVLMGSASSGLTDVDLDCVQAEVIADIFLPPTPAVFGRPSKPKSHYLYECELPAVEGKAVLPFKDPVDGATLLELRVGGPKGAQTMFPPSVHPDGELLAWNSEGEPAEIDGQMLLSKVRGVAALSLLAKHWGKPGNRNEYRLALTGVLLRLGWGEGAVAKTVDAVNCASGADPDPKEARAIVRSVADRAAASGHYYGVPKLAELVGEAIAQKALEWLGAKSGSFARSVEASETEVSQDAVARIFQEQHGQDWRYDHRRAAWFQWSGSIWEQNDTDLVLHLLREIAREVSEGVGKSQMRAARTAGFAAGAEKLARAHPELALKGDEWNSDPMLLGTPQGTVDLKSGNLRPAARRDLISKSVQVAPAATVDCPAWLQFLNEATGGDDELSRFLQQFAGYCLTGLTVEHSLLFVFGPGGNGKSVFLNVLVAMLGQYADTADMDTFTATHMSRHPVELAKLQGARLVTASETEAGRAWAEAKIKQLTGGEQISARYMRENPFTFLPQFKLLIAGNHAPTIQNIDDAMRRRFNVVPFEHKPAKPDKQLETKLLNELPGILRWALVGCLDWLENGLLRPKVVTDATSTYFEEQDTFSLWLEENCELWPKDLSRQEEAALLFQNWADFARASGEDAGSQKAFGMKLVRHGPKRGKNSRGKRVYKGITLRLARVSDPRTPDD